ncbi:SGNH hydrolase-type esterase domain-containing protein, partial [Auriculariales sp. MPI-PUGE-AT-0066]
FGDSYTDVTLRTTGGAMWPDYVSGYARAAAHSFAIGGGVCSEVLTPRPKGPVMEKQIPAFKAKMKALNLDMSKTVFTLWIGTNDIGHNMLVDGVQPKGVTMVDVARCGVDWVKTLYALGARNFISFSMVPLDRAPSYTKPNKNMELLRELIATGNTMRHLMLEAIAPTLPGAHIGYFYTNGLFTDIMTHPKNYLNGTAPLNGASTILDCKAKGGCVKKSDWDSYLWHDDLHPSEQANRIVAREIAAVMKGKVSPWIGWVS